MARRPIERIVDAAIAVPVSVAVAVRQLVPVGPTRLERALARNLGPITRFSRRGVPPPPPDGEAAVPLEVAGALPDDEELDDEIASVSSTDEAPSAVPDAPATTVDDDGTGAADGLDPADAADLPIDGYDQLSARQIVDRLADLTQAELAQIAAHEESNRRRQTILRKIDLLR